MLKHFGCKPWRPKPIISRKVGTTGGQKMHWGFWYVWIIPENCFNIIVLHISFFCHCYFWHVIDINPHTHQHTTGATMSQLMPAMVGSGRGLSSSSMTSWLKPDCAPSLQSKPRRKLHPHHWNILKSGVDILPSRWTICRKTIPTTKQYKGKYGRKFPQATFLHAKQKKRFSRSVNICNVN